MKIAIDFDGTCVTHEFPNVGKDIGAVPVLKKLVEKGHKLILFTMRSKMVGLSPVTGKEEFGGLEDAVKWFEDNGIELYGIQLDPDQYKWTRSVKCYAELYIDDAALGCPLVVPSDGSRPYVDWIKVKKLLEWKGIL